MPLKQPQHYKEANSMERQLVTERDRTGSHARAIAKVFLGSPLSQDKQVLGKPNSRKASPVVFYEVAETGPMAAWIECHAANESSDVIVKIQQLKVTPEVELTEDGPAVDCLQHGLLGTKFPMLNEKTMSVDMRQQYIADLTATLDLIERALPSVEA